MKEARHALDSIAYALQLDAADQLAAIRREFSVPGKDEDEVYFSAHALGPMPRRTPNLIKQELDSWAQK